MWWRGTLCGLGVAFLVVAATPTAVGSSCDPGTEDGVGSEYDANGDGVVCVDQESGAVSDQAGVAPTEADRNNDGVICVKPTPSGSFVTTDNNSSHEENSNCPPAFFPSPAS
jgi:hypothetical protein